MAGVPAWDGTVATERKVIETDYYKLRDEVKDAEQIRKSVYSIIRAEQRETQPRRTQDINR